MARGAKRWLIPGVIVVVAALVASVAVIVLVGSDPAGASVTLERAGRPGVDPFTTSVTIVEIAEFPGSIQAITADITSGLEPDPETGGLQAEGTTPGLYGGTQNETVCDPDQLAGFLDDNPDKAQAWADVLGITRGEISDYLAGLTPVVLTTDTLVTNHGYANGKATPRQSVLQAGTAVLVDDRGVPRVKCGCGNPLAPPTSTPIGSTTGNPWADYQAATVTTITPAPQPAETFTLTDLTTGDTYQQDTTSDNEDVWLVTAGGDGSIGRVYSSGDGGKTWSVERQPEGSSITGMAAGHGRWIGVGPLDEDEPHSGEYGGGAILTSKGGQDWTRVVTVEDPLWDVAYGDGRWVAVGNAADSRTTGVVYTSTDGTDWSRVATTGPSSAQMGSLNLNGISFGNGKWVAIGTEFRRFRGPDDPGGDWSVMLTSNDGVRWTPTKRLDFYLYSIAFGKGEWLAVVSESGNTGRVPGSSPNLSVSTDLVTWSSLPSPLAVQQSSAFSNPIAFGGGFWLLAAGDAPPSGEYLSHVLSSTDGRDWSPVGTVPSLASELANGPSS